MKNPVVKLTDPSLVKLFVQRIVYDNGFERVNWCGIGRIELRPTHDAIELYRDGQFLGKWRLVEQPIAQLPPLIGADGRRYRHLYFQQLPNQQFMIGTRTDLGLKWRYQYNARSKKQRHESPDAIIRKIMRDRKYKRRELKVLRMLEHQGLISL